MPLTVSSSHVGAQLFCGRVLLHCAYKSVMCSVTKALSMLSIYLTHTALCFCSTDPANESQQKLT